MRNDKNKKLKKLDLIYIVDRYPSLTESFTRAEARALVEMGNRVKFISLRRSCADDLKMVDVQDGEEIYCLEDNYKKSGGRLLKHLSLLTSMPLRYFRTLKWTLSHKGSWRLFKALPIYCD